MWTTNQGVGNKDEDLLYQGISNNHVVFCFLLQHHSISFKLLRTWKYKRQSGVIKLTCYYFYTIKIVQFRIYVYNQASSAFQRFRGDISTEKPRWLSYKCNLPPQTPPHHFIRIYTKCFEPRDPFLNIVVKNSFQMLNGRYPIFSIWLSKLLAWGMMRK